MQGLSEPVQRLLRVVLEHVGRTNIVGSQWTLCVMRRNVPPRCDGLSVVAEMEEIEALFQIEGRVSFGRRGLLLIGQNLLRFTNLTLRPCEIVAGLLEVR